MDDVMALPFIKGNELNRAFFTEAVQPILQAHWPNLPYSAAQVGGGSDVLGFDTPQSRDHDWGPKLTLFLTADDLAKQGPEIDQTLRRELPLTIGDYPTHYGRHEDGTDNLQSISQGPVSHRITLTTVAAFAWEYLRYDVDTPLTPAKWLTFPEQHLATLRYGPIFHDSLVELTALRERLHYYPHDLWLYLLAGQWQRLGQEEPFVGRCGDVGDELGSRLIAARQVRSVMRLCFLMEKQYAPYFKWFGSGFARLNCASELEPLLTAVLQTQDWHEREAALTAVYKFMAAWHNRLGLTDPLPEKVSYFYERPYLIIHADRFADALRAQIQDTAVQTLPPGLGGIDQLVDSTDVLSYPQRFARLANLYQPDETGDSQP